MTCPAATRRIVIAELPDFESAERCYRSEVYPSIVRHRTGDSSFEFILTDGVPT